MRSDENGNLELKSAAAYLIEQDYDAYTPEQHKVWLELAEQRMPQLARYASDTYLDGFAKIGSQLERLPRLASVSAGLEPLTR